MRIKDNRLSNACGQTIGDYVTIRTKADLRYVREYSKRVKPVKWLWIVWEPISESGAKQFESLSFDEARAFYRQVKARVKQSSRKLCRPAFIAVPIAIAELPDD